MRHNASLPAFLGLAFLLSAGAARAQEGHDRLVHDEAHVLSESAQQMLERQLERYADSTGVQLAVATWPSLRGLEVSQVGDSVKNAWGVGDRETKKGILYLIAPNEHRQTIRVGRGLEADLPDALCFRILKQTSPGPGENLEQAIVNRVYAIQAQLAKAAASEAARGEFAPEPATSVATQAEVVRQQEVLPNVLWTVCKFLLSVIAMTAIVRAVRRYLEGAPGNPSHSTSAFTQPSRRRENSSSGSDGLLAAAVLLSSEEKRKKSSNDDSSSGWGGWSGSSDDSDSFSMGGDSDAGGGGADGSW